MSNSDLTYGGGAKRQNKTVSASAPPPGGRRGGAARAAHLKVEDDASVEVGVARLRLAGVGVVVLVEVLGRRLRQQPVDGLAFGQHLQRRHATARPRVDRPARVERAQPAARASRSRRPERLAEEINHQKHQFQGAVQGDLSAFSTDCCDEQ